MRKYLFLFVLLTLLVMDNNVSAQTTNKPETNEQLKAQITELEKGITELEKEINELKSVDELKSDMQDSILNKEKDNSSKIYNASIWFITVVGLFVGVGGIYLTYFSNKLAKHQKKINMVLDSKDFDRKVTDIEQRLVDIRLKERERIVSNAKRQFENRCKSIDKLIEDVINSYNYSVIKHLLRDTVVDNLEYSKMQYEDVKLRFMELKDTEITPQNDQEEGYENIEDELVSYVEELEGLLENFERIEIEIREAVRR
ncbi:hypothetical protein ACE8FZ_24715 [Peribacillus frigoritolerans]|uniref:hypothetical protein n=1 Tax=Peribacillus frigoritolerans TaxID=450367 RepID=UPI0035CEF922